MSWFGHFLAQVILAAGDPATKIAALDGLWFLAYVQDQWSVQSLFERVVNQGAVDASVDDALATIILSRGCCVGAHAFAGLPLPALTRAALRRSGPAGAAT
jgi:hypothetical protein